MYYASRLCDITVTAASQWLCALEIAKPGKLGRAESLGQSRGQMEKKDDLMEPRSEAQRLIST